MDPGMNKLLKWSIENSQVSSDNAAGTTEGSTQKSSGIPLNADAVNNLFGGPSDADLMRHSMAAIISPDITLDNKLVAFDNFEQLIEQVDNANNIENLGLWSPLIELLSSRESELRRYACWCIGTAVQNNVQCQERPVALGIVPKLVDLALSDPEEPVRRKAIYALSSEVRNFQPGLDAAVKELPKSIAPEGGLDAGNMDALDQIFNEMRAESARKAAGQ